MHLYRLETIGDLDGLGAREEAMPVPSAGEVLIRVKLLTLFHAGRQRGNGEGASSRPGDEPLHLFSVRIAVDLAGRA